jgi:D-glycero-D-manno-heptose 1,7-bisphosphate phosphatase
VAVPGPATLPAAVLLDRDGTINVKAPEGAYITDPAAVELLPGAGRALASLAARGVPVVVVTNQRGIALGRMTEDDLAAVHARVDELLRAAGARDLLGLADLRDAVMIGDAVSDVQAGRRAGARAIRLAGADAPQDGFERAQSLLVAVRRVLGED